MPHQKKNMKKTSNVVIATCCSGGALLSWIGPSWGLGGKPNKVLAPCCCCPRSFFFIPYKHQHTLFQFSIRMRLCCHQGSSCTKKPCRHRKGWAHHPLGTPSALLIGAPEPIVASVWPRNVTFDKFFKNRLLVRHF